MRPLALLLALALAQPTLAQDKPAPKKKPAAVQKDVKKQNAKKPAANPAAHKKATPEQIRKFNELEKKRQ